MDSAQYQPQRVRRYPFAAAVVIREPATGVETQGLATDLSEGGCFVLTRRLFDRDTRLLLTIKKKDSTLSTPVLVAHSQKMGGMGLAFVETPEDQQAVLKGWLDALNPAMRMDLTRA